MRKSAKLVLALVSVGAVTMLAACGGSSNKSGGDAGNTGAPPASATSDAGGSGSGGTGTIPGENLTVVYEEQPPTTIMTTVLKAASEEYSKATGGKGKLTLKAINAPADDYFTKVALMQKSASTAPDIVSEDSFQLNADVQAGYLAPLDDYLSTWPEWKTAFPEASYAQGTAEDGKVYGVPYSTDTRALWYSKDVFAKAGLPTDWQPKTWQDVLDAAQTIKDKDAAAVPFYSPSTKAQNEQTAMQNFEMLLSGTPNRLAGTLYNSETKKWQLGSKGFLDALTFEQTIRDKGLGMADSDLQNPNVGSLVFNNYFPEGKIGMALDGSWNFSSWLPKDQGGTSPWPEWPEKIGWAAMPTQNGQEPGTTSMSGGWVWSIGAKSSKHDAAFEAIKIIANKENEMKLNIGQGNIPVRSDVASDQTYIDSNPSAEFFASLVKVTQYRPALATYPQVSIKMQEAIESVTTGKSKPDAAQKTYDAAVKQIVGDGKWEQGQ